MGRSRSMPVMEGKCSFHINFILSLIQGTELLTERGGGGGSVRKRYEVI